MSKLLGITKAITKIGYDDLSSFLPWQGFVVLTDTLNYSINTSLTLYSIADSNPETQ